MVLDALLLRIIIRRNKMNKFTKPAVTVLITTLMILSSCVCFCFADDQTDGFKTVSLPVDRYESDTPLDNDELFEGYVDSLLGSGTTKKYAAKRRARLTGINLAIYEKIKPEIAEVANGSRTSTVFEVSLDELRLEKNGWTAEELGVAAIVQDGEVTKEAIDALVRVIGLDFDAILNTLLVESPFELYWFDKVSGIGIDGGDIGVCYAGEELILELDSGFLFEFSVAQGYAAGPYEVDTTNIERVNRAIDKAAAVVDAYKNENDYLRLLAYKNTICDFVGISIFTIKFCVAYRQCSGIINTTF